MWDSEPSREDRSVKRRGKETHTPNAGSPLEGLALTSRAQVPTLRPLSRSSCQASGLGLEASWDR